MINNRIVTRGMGRSRGALGRVGMVTLGHGGIFKALSAAAVRTVKLGQSGAKRVLRELEEVIISARLIRVNDVPPSEPIQGFVKVRIDLSKRISVAAQSISRRARKAWEDIKITIKRIK